MNHNSPIINSVAKLSIANPWSNCSANYRHVLNEWDTMYDVSVHDIGRVWQAGLSNVTISNVNVLSEMNRHAGLYRCNACMWLHLVAMFGVKSTSGKEGCVNLPALITKCRVRG